MLKLVNDETGPERASTWDNLLYVVRGSEINYCIYIPAFVGFEDCYGGLAPSWR